MAIIMLTGYGVGEAHPLWQKQSLSDGERILAFVLMTGPVEDTELAEALGLNQEDGSRVLTELKRQKLISVVRGVPANVISPEQKRAALRALPKRKKPRRQKEAKR